MKKLTIIILSTVVIASAFIIYSRVDQKVVVSTSSKDTSSVAPPFMVYEHSAWVDSVLNSLTPDERIAQLIVVAAYSNRGEEHRKEILKLINDQKVGGLIFFQGGPGRQAALLNEYQRAAEVPLLVAIDAEWGLGMRLDSTISFPYQMTLGAIRNNELIYDMGKEIARQLKRSGIHVNLAPVVDVNNNPANPVINYRSFGENKYNVAEKGIAYMKGMQDQNILTTAKHFPGHGDTGTDSHYALPQINHPRQRLDSLELYPFRKLIEAGAGGIMVAHLNVPALDPTVGLPSTLSKPIITGLLKEELGYKGLIVTDAMNMKGVTRSNPPGVVDKDAILAGNDMLEFTEDVPRAIAEIRKALEQGLISQDEINAKCRKMLAVKQWVKLNKYAPVEIDNIVSDLNTPAAKALNRKLIEASITVLNNKDNLIPVHKHDSLRIASVSFGVEEETVFQEALSRHREIKHFVLSKNAQQAEVAKLIEQLKPYNLIIGALHESSTRPANRLYISTPVQEMISKLSEQDNLIMAVFKNPYVLDKLKKIEQADALLITYQDNTYAEQGAAQLILGCASSNGRLPVSIGDKFSAGDGLKLNCTH